MKYKIDMWGLLFSYNKLITIHIISSYGLGAICPDSSTLLIISPWNLQINRGNTLLWGKMNLAVISDIEGTSYPTVHVICILLGNWYP